MSALDANHVLALISTGWPERRYAMLRVRIDAVGKPVEHEALAHVPASGRRLGYFGLRSAGPWLGIHLESGTENWFWLLNLGEPKSERLLRFEHRVSVWWLSVRGTAVVESESGLFQVKADGSREHKWFESGSAQAVRGGSSLLINAGNNFQLFDLVSEQMTPLVGMPSQASFAAQYENGAILFTAESAPGKTRLQCPTHELYRLDSPYDSPPVLLAGDLVDSGAVQLSTHTSIALIAKNPRSPWAELLTDLKFSDDADPAQDDQEQSPLCGAALFSRPQAQVDLLSYDVADGGFLDHGCRQRNQALKLGDNEARDFLNVFSSPCVSPDSNRKRLAKLSIPSLAKCSPLKRRVDHCLAAIELGDLPALARCMGRSRTIPDLGIVLPWREWVLQQNATEPPLKSVLIIKGETAEASLVARDESTNMRMVFQRKGCEWEMREGDIVRQPVTADEKALSAIGLRLDQLRQPLENLKAVSSNADLIKTEVPILQRDLKQGLAKLTAKQRAAYDRYVAGDVRLRAQPTKPVFVPPPRSRESREVQEARDTLRNWLNRISELQNEVARLGPRAELWRTLRVKIVLLELAQEHDGDD